MLNFDLLEKDLGIVSTSHFVYDFQVFQVIFEMFLVY